MVFYAVFSDEIEQVIQFFNTPAAAEAMLEVRSKTSRTGEKSSTPKPVESVTGGQN